MAGKLLWVRALTNNEITARETSVAMACAEANRAFGSDDSARVSGTGFRARPADQALRPVGDRTAIDRPDRAVGTGLHAGQAGDAQVRAQHHLRAEELALRVVAPGAAQRAAFEEDSRADPRPIVGREAHDVEDDPALAARIALSLGVLRRGLLFGQLQCRRLHKVDNPFE